MIIRFPAECRLEVAGGVILGCDVKAVTWWEILKLQAVVTSEIIEKKIFPDAEVGGGIYAICSRPEVADDVISGYNLETFLNYHATNLRVTSFSSFPENLN